MQEPNRNHTQRKSLISWALPLKIIRSGTIHNSELDPLLGTEEEIPPLADRSYRSRALSTGLT
jgi:hypothetical protein